MEVKKKWDSADMSRIVEGIRAGEESAQAEFYDRTNKMAYSIAIQMVKDEADAMDILQEAYVTAFTKIDNLKDQEKLVSWFNMIVANRCRDFLRKKKPVLFNEMNTEETEFEASLENENEEFIPEANVDYSETKRLMKEILNGLPEEQRLCVLMYYYQELSLKQIAAALNCTENTVKSRLNYSRKKIKAEVLELEKKGTKLYGIAPMPFISWMLRDGEALLHVPDVLQGLVQQQIQAGASATSAAKGAGTKAAATAAAGAGKAIVTKVVAIGIAAVLAVGGGIFISKNLSAPEPEEVVAEIGEEYLEDLLCYIPVYEEGEAVPGDHIYKLLQWAMSVEYIDNTFTFPESLPSIIDDDKFSIDRNTDSGPVVWLAADGFYKTARLLGYTGPIDKTFLDKYAPYTEMTSVYDVYFADGRFTANPDPGGSWRMNYSAEINSIEEDGDDIIIYYTLTWVEYMDDYTISGERAVTLRERDNGYVIISNVDVNNPSGVESILELIGAL